MDAVLTLPNKDLLHAPYTAVPPDLHRLSTLSWEVSSASVSQMPIETIVVSRNGHGETENLDGLTASIRARGVLEPLIVTPEGRLLAGRRRLVAARRAGLTVVPVRVCEVSDERAAIEISLVENVVRADLDPLTRAKSYRGLVEQGATVEDIATLVGQGIGHVYQHLALLDLHPEVQKALHASQLRFADARALAPLDLEEQAVVLQEIRRSPTPLSSRQVKARVDAQRVMRLVEKADTIEPQNGDDPKGNYAALFETENARTNRVTAGASSNPLDELNAIIAEMVAAAQGEDQLRTWARRLSHILEILSDSGRTQQVTRGTAEKGNDVSGAVQDRLL